MFKRKFKSGKYETIFDISLWIGLGLSVFCGFAILFAGHINSGYRLCCLYNYYGVGLPCRQKIGKKR